MLIGSVCIACIPRVSATEKYRCSEGDFTQQLKQRNDLCTVHKVEQYAKEASAVRQVV